MIPKSFSASAFQVAETCLARYYAENVLRSERPPNLAADLGTAVHNALEWYVKAVYIDKVKPASLEALLLIYRMTFMATFETVDPEGHEWYAEGRDMLKTWFARTDFEGRTVISVETKSNFMIKTSAGDIPFNYIWDRCDQLDEETIEVVDYKTIRRGLQPAELRKKIQARFYGLAAQIQFPKAKRIWVRFDLLRHDSVATVFTREDNAATWAFAKALAKKILDAPVPGSVDAAGNVVPWPEKLNSECHFCVRKAQCSALTSNVMGGGIGSLATTDERINRRALLEFQRKGLDALITELDEVLLREAAQQDATELEGTLFTAEVQQSFRRKVDPERVEHVVGRDMFFKYGGIKLNLTDYNKLIKDPSLTQEQINQLRSLVYRAAGELKINIKSKNPIDDE